MNDANGSGKTLPPLNNTFTKNNSDPLSKLEADALKKRAEKKVLHPSPELTIGGYKEKIIHETINEKENTRIKHIEQGLNKTAEKVQLKSRFKRHSRSRR